MLPTCLGQIAIKGVIFMTTDKCISIGTPPEIITLIHEAYATRVITKPKYSIIAVKIISKTLNIELYGQSRNRNSSRLLAASTK